MYFCLYSDHNYLDDKGIELILQNDLDHLQHLQLKSNAFTSGAVANLMNKGLPNLRSLSLAQNRLNTTAIQAIEKVGPFLIEMDLSSCTLRGDSLDLIKKFSLPNLQELRLDYNEFTELEMIQFVAQLETRKMRSLKKVSMRGISMGLNNYNTLVEILASKKWGYDLDRPHNYEMKNAATY